MPERTWSRRAVLGRCCGVGAVAIGAAPAGAAQPRTRTQQSDLGGSPGFAASCTPGHDGGTSACTQIRNDREALVRFDAAGTGLDATFAYPCGWRTAVTDYDDRIQATVTRSGIGEADAYVGVQVLNYTDPVGERYLQTERSDGKYDDVAFEYDGATRTGIVSSADTARYGTTAHAVLPRPGGDEFTHVEIASTLKGVDCPQPQPDYLLVEAMLTSLEPNYAAPGYPEASVTMSDQRVSGEVETQSVVVDRVDLSAGGFVTIVGEELPGGLGDVLGVSSRLSAGQHENVLIALQESLERDRSVAAVAHLDTDDDVTFEYGQADGVDVPYRNGAGAPVHDDAAIEVVQDTPVPTDEGSTPSTTAAGDSTGASTSTHSSTAIERSSTSDPGETTAGGGPGFGIGGAIGGIAGSVLAGWYLHVSGSE